MLGRRELHENIWKNIPGRKKSKEKYPGDRNKDDVWGVERSGWSVSDQ